MCVCVCACVYVSLCVLAGELEWLEVLIHLVESVPVCVYD